MDYQYFFGFFVKRPISMELFQVRSGPLKLSRENDRMELDFLTLDTIVVIESSMPRH